MPATMTTGPEPSRSAPAAPTAGIAENAAIIVYAEIAVEAAPGKTPTD